MARSFWRRLGFGAVVGAGGLGLPTVILILLTLTGGRFQTGRGGEHDMWVTTLVYPLGAAVAGAMVFGLAPFVRRASQAALLGFVAGYPMFALLSLASAPHGLRAYHVSWGIAALAAAAVGGPAGVLIYRADPKPRDRHSRHQHRA